MYLASAALYKATLDEELRTGLLGPPTRLLCKDLQNFDSYRSDLYSAVFARLEKVKTAAAAASRTFRDFFMTQVPVAGSEKMAAI